MKSRPLKHLNSQEVNLAISISFTLSHMHVKQCTKLFHKGKDLHLSPNWAKD